MPSTIAALASAAPALAWLFNWARRRRLARRTGVPRPSHGLPAELRAATPTTIAEAQPGGLVAVIGRVLAPAELIAPLSRRRCVAYDVVIQRSWNSEVLGREVSGEPFAIEDVTGRAVVDPRGGYVRVVLDHTDDADALPDASARPGAGGELRSASEGIVTVGARVLVIGVVHRTDDGPEAPYRRAGAPVIRIASGGERSALVSSLAEDLATFE